MKKHLNWATKLRQAVRCNPVGAWDEDVIDIAAELEAYAINEAPPDPPPVPDFAAAFRRGQEAAKRRREQRTIRHHALEAVQEMRRQLPMVLEYDMRHDGVLYVTTGAERRSVVRVAWSAPPTHCDVKWANTVRRCRTRAEIDAALCECLEDQAIAEILADAIGREK